MPKTAFTAAETAAIATANAKAKARDPKAFAATQAAIAAGRAKLAAKGAPDKAAKAKAAVLAAAAATNKPGRVSPMPDTRPARIAANVAKRQLETATAKAAVDAALPRVGAKHKPQAKAAPAPRQGASGALIGVAQGAMDGQPHTRRAVEEARANARDPAAKALDEARRTVARLERETGTVVAGTDFAAPGRTEQSALRAAAAKRKTVLATARHVLAQLEAQAAKTPERRAADKAKRDAAAKPAPKAAAPKAPRAAPADRAYAKGKVDYAGKAGSWTAYMVAITLAHKSTAAATAAHKAGAAKAGQPAAKPLDFKWMDAKGYIALK